MVNEFIGIKVWMCLVCVNILNGYWYFGRWGKSLGMTEFKGII